MISYNSEYLIVSYLSYALTNSYGITVLTVGIIFLFCRIFDGLSDIVAGVIIDKSNPKDGKARVYDLLHIPPLDSACFGIQCAKCRNHCQGNLDINILQSSSVRDRNTHKCLLSIYSRLIAKNVLRP